MPQEQKSPLLLIAGVAVAALILGGIGGYFAGSYQTMRSINEQIAAQQRENAGTVNPYAEVETNPLGDVKTNPYSDVKVNPFD